MSDRWRGIKILTPNKGNWAKAAYLQLKPYDGDPPMEIAPAPDPERSPLPGTIRNYAVELVMHDDTRHFLHIGMDLTAAKHLIQALSAEHDVPIRRLGAKRSDISGY